MVLVVLRGFLFLSDGGDKMNLSMDDLRHAHKVLSSDVEECEVLREGATGGRNVRLSNRILDDRRVLARIERIIGEQPEYAPVQE